MILSCQSGKRRYDRLRAVEVARLDRYNTGELILPYFCKRCGWWHVGHTRNTANAQRQLARHEIQRQA